MELKLVPILTIILISICCQCSLFEPRNTFEDPDDQNVVDMRWIASILECPKTIESGVRFDSYLFTEIFTEEFEYQDENDGVGGNTKTYKRSPVIERLNTIGNPISVEWLDAGTCTNRDPDTILVRDTKYEIVFPDSIKVTGISHFDIVKQDKYRISKWRNFPSGSTSSYLTPIQD